MAGKTSYFHGGGAPEAAQVSDRYDLKAQGALAWFQESV